MKAFVVRAGMRSSTVELFRMIVGILVVVRDDVGLQDNGMWRCEAL
jgi:hypothetical protein